MKTPLLIFLALALALAASAKPTFLALPGTPEGDALENAATPAAPTVPAVPQQKVETLKPTTPAVVATPPPPAPEKKSAPPATPSVPAADEEISTAVPAPAAPAAPVIAAPPAPGFPPAPGQPPAARPTRVTNNSNTARRPIAPIAPVAPGAAQAALSASSDSAAGAAAAKAINASGDMIPAGMIRFQAAPLEQVLDFYAELVGRTILRPAQLPAANITIRTQTELSREEAIQAIDAVLGLNQIVMIPVGTKFVKAVPQGQANQEGATINTNGTSADLPELGQYITHVVQLKYAKPSEVAQVVASFSKMPTAATPLDSNGILILRDYTENVKRMLELIEKIDVSVPSDFVSEVIPIKYALASEIASALNSVGGASSGAIGGGSTGVGAPASAGASRGVTGRGGFGANNSSGINGAQPGQPGYNPFNRGSTVGGVPGVNNGTATAGGAGAAPTFAQRLAGIIQKAGQTGDFQLIGPNKIIADERTNSLLVFATQQDMDMIKNIINKLDVVLAQVLIEALILDVSLGDDFDFGVSAGQQGKQYKTTPAIAGGGALNNGDGSANNALNFLKSFVTGAGTNAASGFPSANGLTYFGKFGPQWDVAINALADNSKGRVLARPRIQTSHAVPASIFVGETYPYITGTYYDGYNSGSRSQYQQQQIGISLSVTPLINPDGLVVMDISQQVQQVGRTVKIDQNDVPVTEDQNAAAKVAVKNGDTIVMGGFIQNQKSEAKSGVPVLKDVPLLGALFRSTTQKNSRRELLVLIKPTVLPTPEVAALQPDVERKNLPALREAEAEFSTEDAALVRHADKKLKNWPAPAAPR